MVTRSGEICQREREYGNKVDLVSQEKRGPIAEKVAETRAIIEEILAQYPSIVNIEGSAKGNIGIENVFLTVTSRMLETRRMERKLHGDQVHDLHSRKIRVGGGQDSLSCCFS